MAEPEVSDEDLPLLHSVRDLSFRRDNAALLRRRRLQAKALEREALQQKRKRDRKSKKKAKRKARKRARREKRREEIVEAKGDVPSEKDESAADGKEDCVDSR